MIIAIVAPIMYIINSLLVAKPVITCCVEAGVAAAGSTENAVTACEG
jgi:hypothetical protein